MTNDQWAEHQARQIAGIVTSNAEAARVEMAARAIIAHARAEALKAAHEREERAVAAERERISVLEARNAMLVSNCATYRAAVDADVVLLLDRLNNPDEAMVEAVDDLIGLRSGGQWAMRICRALAAELGKTTED